MTEPPNKRCAECFHVNASSVKFCGECGHQLGAENEQRFLWWRENSESVLVSASAILFLSWIFLPTPFNPGYLVKRIIFTPSAICRDGIHSFSVSRSGTCSGHGGVRNWVK